MNQNIQASNFFIFQNSGWIWWIERGLIYISDTMFSLFAAMEVELRSFLPFLHANSSLHYYMYPLFIGLFKEPVLILVVNCSSTLYVEMTRMAVCATYSTNWNVSTPIITFVLRLLTSMYIIKGDITLKVVVTDEWCYLNL